MDEKNSFSFVKVCNKDNTNKTKFDWFELSFTSFPVKDTHKYHSLLLDTFNKVQDKSLTDS